MIAPAELLAWIPFIHPMKLPEGGRLWMFLPLALAVTVVYRATRAVDMTGFWRGVAITFVNIVVGMCAIALAAYGVHRAVLYFT